VDEQGTKPDSDSPTRRLPGRGRRAHQGTGMRSDHDRRTGPLRGAVTGVAAVVVALAAALGLSTTAAVVAASPASATTVPGGVAGVEALYAADLVSRINAERAARNSAATPIPQLQVDPSLQTHAQLWSAHIAATGVVQDPTLTSCNASGGANQVCILAANSGDSGSGFWPGDGSDGMDGDYMASAFHRENELGAAYTSVGVGVTCSGNQAWTVEVFGYAYGDYPSASARQSAQNSLEGQPVPATPMVAGGQTGDPVYCPGQTVGPGNQVTATGGQYSYPYSVAGVPDEPSADTLYPAVGMASTPDGNGYWVVRSNGSVSAHGDAVNYGSMSGTSLNAPITHLVSTPDGKGYWLVGSDGGIFSFGDARFFGSMGGHPLNAPVVGLAPTPDGNGYWLVGADGGIFAFGDAKFFGSMGGHPLNAPIVGMAADRATGGYWLVGSDGGIFSFDAPFYGSTGSLHLNKPVNGMAATPSGNGYWFVASDGGIFNFGGASFAGSAGSLQLAAPVVGMAADPATGGYWLVGSDGGIFTFGAPFLGTG
jgi:uncharacterized protein YkwD